MKNHLDWICLSRTGSELIATLSFLKEESDVHETMSEHDCMGPPMTALKGPCLRCRYFSRIEDKPFCYFCENIAVRSEGISSISRNSVGIWGYLNQVPNDLKESIQNQIYTNKVDDQHFIAVISKNSLKTWFQDLLIDYGLHLQGLLQLFPIIGRFNSITMADIIAHIIFQETNVFPSDLSIQFYGSPEVFLKPGFQMYIENHTFQVSDFLSLLERADLFRSILRFDEQEELIDILKKGDISEKQFYWGRFIGRLNQKAKDMISAWNIRQWDMNQLEMLYELINFIPIKK